MGNKTVQFVYEFYVVWKATAAQNIMKKTLGLRIGENNLSAWNGGVLGKSNFLGVSSSCSFMVLCTGELLVISIKQNNFLE